MYRVSHRTVKMLVWFMWLWIGVGAHKLCQSHYHPLKHTWDCQVVYVNSHIYWFMRPNHELFEMYFDNPPILQLGMQLHDIAYTDDNADMRHFVKATMAMPGVGGR